MKEDKTRQTYDQFADQITERFWGVALTRSWESFLSVLPPNPRIIDIGSGAGRDVYHFIEQGASAYGLDYSAGLLAKAAQRGAAVFMQADMRALPLAPDSFDGAWLCASLLHLPKDEVPGVLQAVNRLLKTGGIVYISLKQGEGEKWETREGPRFFSYFSAAEVEELVQQASFIPLEIWLDQTEKLTWINLLAGKRAR